MDELECEHNGEEKSGEECGESNGEVKGERKLERMWMRGHLIKSKKSKEIDIKKQLILKNANN